MTIQDEMYSYFNWIDLYCVIIMTGVFTVMSLALLTIVITM
jgi:hypothetical protein